MFLMLFGLFLFILGVVFLKIYRHIIMHWNSVDATVISVIPDNRRKILKLQCSDLQGTGLERTIYRQYASEGDRMQLWVSPQHPNRFFENGALECFNIAPRTLFICAAILCFIGLLWTLTQ